jgi:hypothetical protein
MVNAINLQMTTKNDIATWKANRRKLAYSTVGTPDYVRHLSISRLEGRREKSADDRSPPRSSCSRVTGRNVIGGPSVLSCLNV